MHFGMCKLVMFSGNRCWHLYTQALCLSSYITWGNIVIFWPSLVRGDYLATSWHQLGGWGGGGGGRFIYKRPTADSSAPVLSWLPWRQHPSDARSPEALTPPYTITILKPWRLHIPSPYWSLTVPIQNITWSNPDCPDTTATSQGMPLSP